MKQNFFVYLLDTHSLLKETTMIPLQLRKTKKRQGKILLNPCLSVLGLSYQIALKVTIKKRESSMGIAVQSAIG